MILENSSLFFVFRNNSISKAYSLLQQKLGVKEKFTMRETFKSTKLLLVEC